MFYSCLEGLVVYNGLCNNPCPRAFKFLVADEAGILRHSVPDEEVCLDEAGGGVDGQAVAEPLVAVLLQVGAQFILE